VSRLSNVGSIEQWVSNVKVLSSPTRRAPSEPPTRPGPAPAELLALIGRSGRWSAVNLREDQTQNAQFGVERGCHLGNQVAEQIGGIARSGLDQDRSHIVRRTRQGDTRRAIRHILVFGNSRLRYTR
jgi:hypothetical protein